SPKTEPASTADKTGSNKLVSKLSTTSAPIGNIILNIPQEVPVSSDITPAMIKKINGNIEASIDEFSTISAKCSPILKSLIVDPIIYANMRMKIAVNTE